MQSWTRTTAACGAVLCALVALRRIPPVRGAQPGVVVDAVEGGGLAHGAGLRAGDRLVAWRASCPGREAGGALDTPLELKRIEGVEAPLCPVMLTGFRDG